MLLSLLKFYRGIAKLTHLLGSISIYAMLDLHTCKMYGRYLVIIGLRKYEVPYVNKIKHLALL